MRYNIKIKAAIILFVLLIIISINTFGCSINKNKEPEVSDDYSIVPNYHLFNFKIKVIEITEDGFFKCEGLNDYSMTELRNENGEPVYILPGHDIVAEVLLNYEEGNIFDIGCHQGILNKNGILYYICETAIQLDSEGQVIKYSSSQHPYD